MKTSSDKATSDETAKSAANSCCQSQPEIVGLTSTWRIAKAIGNVVYHFVHSFQDKGETLVTYRFWNRRSQWWEYKTERLGDVEFAIELEANRRKRR